MVARDGHHNLIGHRVHLQNALDFGDVVVTVGALGVFCQLLAAAFTSLYVNALALLPALV